MALNRLPPFELLNQLTRVRDETVFAEMAVLCALAEAAYAGEAEPELAPSPAVFDRVIDVSKAAGWRVSTRNTRVSETNWRRTLVLSVPPGTAPKPMGARAWDVAANGAVAWIGPAAYLGLVGADVPDLARLFVRNTLRFWRSFYERDDSSLRGMRIMLAEGQATDYINFARECRNIGYEVTLDPAWGELRVVI